MNKDFKIPPKSVKILTSPNVLTQYFSELIGKPFILTGKTRTDGSNIRKLIASVLEKQILPEPAERDDFEIVPPKGKGVPKITREFIDTYIVTGSDTYNLQVWNRLPASQTLLIKYESSESLKCTDVRFVFVKIDVSKNVIASVIILTPEYIEQKFGRFGKPTVKQQLLISSKVRKAIYESATKILSLTDSKKLFERVKEDYSSPKVGMNEEPDVNKLFSITLLEKIVAEKLIGFKLAAAATKNRGQALERKVLELLGYQIQENDLLYGAFPDIPNQFLEVKVQDSPTVDFGKFSPEKESVVFESSNLTTFDARYLIALTNPKTEIIEGIILSSGERIGELFSYVSDQSYKCQRSIPKAFFDTHYGKSVFNPE
jgi:hypothetical protein